MTVYYVADKEKPTNTENVKFFMDHSSALSVALELRGSVFEFEVNDKCETDSFGMDTVMLFQKSSETGELKFLGSGRWVELHEVLNIPFYYDFEARSKNFVSMSLRYFNKHYKIVDVIKSDIKQPIEKVTSVIPEKSNEFEMIDADILSELFGVK